MKFIVDNQLLLHPGGTVSRRFQAPAQHTTVLLDDFLALFDDDNQLPVDYTIVYLAYELLQFQPDLNPQDQRALFILILLCLIYSRQGSTRIPLDYSQEGFIAREIAQYIPVSPDNVSWQSDSLLSAIQTIIENHKAPHIIGSSHAYTPLVIDENSIYQQRLLRYELRAINAIKKRVDSTSKNLDIPPNSGLIKTHLEDILARSPALENGLKMQLNSEQQYAVLTALHLPLTLITGGPGTGKTSILVSILRMLMRLGYSSDDIALAAPTGKAANRMAQSLTQQLQAIPNLNAVDNQLYEQLPIPRTLHRLLGYSPLKDTFVHHRNNRLDAKFILIDEASMIDIFLMTRLFESIDDDAHLILLGDAQQLPSVDTGAIFQDLIAKNCATDTPWRTLAANPIERTVAVESTSYNTVRLQQSYRMDPTHKGGRKILQLAKSIQIPERHNTIFQATDEHDKQLLIQHRTNHTELVHEGVEFIHTPEKYDDTYNAILQQFIKHWYINHIANLDAYSALIKSTYCYDGTAFNDHDTERLKTLFAHYNAMRVLTLTRYGATGTQALNALFHIHAAAAVQQSDSFDFVVGEPVMMTRNDYQRGIFNGDQGLILWVKMPDNPVNYPMVVFPHAENFRPFPLKSLFNHLDHAFALTVHKSQGSEFKNIAIALPIHDSSLLTRESIYTALTRASQSVVIIGHQSLMLNGIKRTIKRFSGIQNALDPQPQNPGSSKRASSNKSISSKHSSKPNLAQPAMVQGELFPQE